ncbi:hypothetical protein FJZ26_01140 [Candidatus Parvarchaeota archaeon]|nr:hypothetical protein [Candidatus Parvarchaeota archaeon]
MRDRSWEFYRQTFEALNGVYEKGTEEERRTMAKILGVAMVEGFYADLGLIDQVKAAYYFLTENNMVKQLFGSVDDIFRAMTGDPPRSKIMNLIKGDAKLRSFGLMCAQSCLEYLDGSKTVSAELYKEYGSKILNEELDGLRPAELMQIRQLLSQNKDLGVERARNFMISIIDKYQKGQFESLGVEENNSK